MHKISNSLDPFALSLLIKQPSKNVIEIMFKPLGEKNGYFFILKSSIAFIDHIAFF